MVLRPVEKERENGVIIPKIAAEESHFANARMVTRRVGK
jgi:hypothetical protein